MGIITFLKQTAASVPTPAAGKVSVFVDSTTGEPCYKDADALTPPLGPGLWIGRRIFSGNASIASAAAAGTYKVSPAGQELGGLITANNNQGGNFYFDPADYEYPSKKVKLKLTAVCMTPDTASTITHTVGLYPVTGSSGATTELINTVGAVTAGSTVAFANQGAKTIAVKSQLEIEIAQGLYALGDLTSGTNTTNCRTVLHASLHIYWG